ncbi:MAG: sulfotransferase domain-containing protein [Phycisphaeraceae bacterium]|nr:MAG: sulfotransferase domain-containing protein [Phycisphaeraceae bacterium]
MPTAPGIQAGPLDALRGDIARTPADARHLQRLEPLLAMPETARRALGVLFEWYVRQGVPDQVRGLLVYFIVDAVRADARHFDPRSLGVDPEAHDAAVIDPGLYCHLHHAAAGVDLARRLETGLPQRDAPKFIVAVQKSGSSLLADLLAGMVRLDRGLPLDHPARFRGYPAWWNLGRGHDWDLRADIGADPLFAAYPGGVYKGHIPPSQKNLRILEIYRTSRYLVCLRDPRDQAAADFCQSLRVRVNAGTLDEPLSREAAHRALDDMLRGGTVFESLHFVGKWLKERDPERSLVVTYERLMTEPIATLRDIARLYEMDLADTALEHVWSSLRPTTDRRTGADKTGGDRRIYPLGWTGEIGIHTKYFDETNGANFDAVFRGFEAAGPWAGAIREVYPAL